MHYSTATRRRILTFAAIAMVISSSLISFFLVQRNDHMIADLKRSQEKTEQAIAMLWNNAGNAERNADAMVIVSLLAKDADPATSVLRQYYLSRTGLAAGAGNMDVLKAADEARRNAVEKINDLYLSQLDVENEIMARESMNRRYADFAFLLQLISLVLVILTREMPNG